MRKFKKTIFFTFLFIAALTMAHFALAADLDVGLEQAAGTGLGNEDPRAIAANIIRIIFGFLGILAVGLIVYAGWLWMTAAGSAEKIEKAKKILIGAIIGLIICLSAFAIASFILSKLLEATGSDSSGGGGGNMGSGGGSGGRGLPGIGEPCLTDILDTTCAAGECSSGLVCGKNCLCEEGSGPGEGESCDADPAAEGCQEIKCVGDFLCSSEDNCTCIGTPLIAWISPLDASSTPNGAPGNFITIGGKYFGQIAGQVVFLGDPETAADDKLASFPDSVNPNCASFWQNDQIIAIAPSGAVDGPVKVIAANKKEDTTDNDRGPYINDFDVNGFKRPGLCLADPDSGFFADKFNLQGNSFTGVSQGVFFGTEKASTTANNISNWTNTSVDAAVPNIAAGRNAVFASVSGVSSNSLRFKIEDNSLKNPTIDYIEPPAGPAGQYITIYGRNFGLYEGGKSLVKFYLPTDPEDLIDADIDFPAACQGKWWHDGYITVKVPKTEADDYKVTVVNKDGRASAPADFKITSGKPGPGLCALIPHNGPVSQKVTAHGERFGSSQGGGKAVFYNNKEGLINEWADGQAETSVPAGAETGPFKMADNDGSQSNSLPFKVGSCSASSECELGEECCPSGAYWAGICRGEGTCDEGAPKVCGYGWTFSTSGETNILTCSGYTDAQACQASDGCPNSPGMCQTKKDLNTGQACGDSYCNENYSICSGKCVYLASLGNKKINKCSLGGASCDSKKLVASYTAECREIGKKGIWQINMKGASCPNGTFLDTNGWCALGSLGSPQGCDLCPSDFACQEGQCVINSVVCPVGSSCAGDKCLKDNDICECCCRVGHDSEDCCVGLKCEAGNCGTGGLDYGLCVGCKVVIAGKADQAASDNACNCKVGSSSRYCDLTNYSYPNGVCRDKGSEGSFCDSDPSSPSCEANNGLCQEGLFCDPAKNCTCQKGGDIGSSCDADPNTPSCDADANRCQQGLVCDPDINCTCQPSGSLGLTCAVETESGPQCDPNSCNFSCLNEDGSSNVTITSNSYGCGTCCCDPFKTGDNKGSADYDKCNELNPASDSKVNLACKADQTPCSGDSRGLCCGCSQDSHCGGGAALGCGFDACCRARPGIEVKNPGESEENVCRNAMITATFNQLMDITSFEKNIVVMGDYGTSQCPAGTKYLTFDGYKKTLATKIADRLIRILARLPFIDDFLFGGRAMAATGNFCAISGTIGGYNTADNKTVLTFSQTKLLDGGRKYIVIIKGDGETNDSLSEGILSYYGIGLSAAGNETYNGLTHKGEIWSFTTLAEQSANNGICAISKVEMAPPSYLFKTTKNDLKEKDNNPADKTFDTVKDNDKIFVTRALSDKGKPLVSVSGYSWTWGWSNSKPQVADFVNIASLPSDKKLVRAKEGVTDDKTTLTATATVSPDTSFSAKADVYVFVCENPWPPIGSDGTWEPWGDRSNTCLPGSGDCSNTNYELYYCRDAGKPGTVDDLPAILSNDTIIRGATPGQNVLKEFYFLREPAPSVSTLSVSDQATGGKVYASWATVSGAAGYKLYYGLASGSYTKNINVGNATSRLVSDLENNKIYYFSVTAYYATGAESSRSNEVTVTPTDKTSPAVPKSLKTEAAGNSVNLSWDANTDDTAKYKVYYGTSSGVYGKAVDAGKAIGATIANLTAGNIYYFTVSAVDAAGNESGKAIELSITLNP